MDSETGRFQRLFCGRDSVPGLAWPTHSFERKMTLWLGEREAQAIHIGRAHTAGDTVELGAAPCCGDAHSADWPATLRAVRDLGPEKLAPGRGPALLTRNGVAQRLADTGAFTGTLFARVREGAAKGWALREIHRDTVDHMRPRFDHSVIFDHCMPFNASHAFDEAQGTTHPRVWTAERDTEMWRALEGDTPARSADARP